jgi:hypothetical protein
VDDAEVLDVDFHSRHAAIERGAVDCQLARGDPKRDVVDHDPANAAADTRT